MAHRMSARHGPGSHACGSDISNGELGVGVPVPVWRAGVRMPQPETANPDSYTLTRVSASRSTVLECDCRPGRVLSRRLAGLVYI